MHCCVNTPIQWGIAGGVSSSKSLLEALHCGDEQLVKPLLFYTATSAILHCTALFYSRYFGSKSNSCLNKIPTLTRHCGDDAMVKHGGEKALSMALTRPGWCRCSTTGAVKKKKKSSEIYQNKDCFSYRFYSIF